MKGKKTVKNKKTRIIRYSALTVILTCLFVTGYFLISNGVIFGKFTVKDNTYTKGEVSDITGNQINVTDQKGEGIVPLTSDNESLPTIPGFEGTKGSKSNPFVLLEVVPDLSQQSMSLMTGSQDDGLPFDPIEFGKTICADSSLGITSFINQSDKTKLKSTSDINQKLNNFNYGYFPNLFNQSGFTTALLDESGESYVKMNYFDTAWLYELSLYSSDISENDFNTKTMQNIFNDNAESFVTAYPSLFAAEKDADGNITSVTVLDDSLLTALSDENNWSRVKELNADVGKSYGVEVAASDVNESDFNNLTMTELAAKYPTLFTTDKNGNAITAEALAKNAKWERASSDKTELLNKGYLVKTAAGEGDFTVSGGLNRWSSNITITKTGTSTDMWKYVEDESTITASMIDYDTLYPEYARGSHFSDEGNVGCYIKLYTDATNYNPNWHSAVKTEKIYSFDYAKYKYTLKYAGMKFNNILKYSLFERDTMEKYDELDVKVIVVTPEMLNEMDANDTANTVDYIERADAFYISQYYDGFDKVADNSNRIVNFYNKYCGGSGVEIGNGSHEGMETFDHNDLEWFDCMKIIKRVSTNACLPLAFTKLVGTMENEGVDGTFNTDMYIDANNQSVEVKSALTNMSKLYNITLQFDLLDQKTEAEKQVSYGSPGYRRTFIDDIFPYIKCMKLNSDQRCSDDSNAPKYTGYYERSVLAIPGRSQEYNERAYYLWNKFTFLPTDITGIYGSNGPYDVLENYGYLKSYFYQNALQNAYDTRGTAASPGSDGTDDKNVFTATSPDQPDNINMSYPLSSATVDYFHEVMKNIINNGGDVPDNLTLNLLKYPKYYTKMTNDTLLIDYSAKAKYRDENKIVYVRFDLKNTNNEAAIVKKISLVDSETSEEGIILKLENDQGEQYSKETVVRTDGNAGVVGYRVDANDMLSCYVPVKLKDWQENDNANRIIKVDWVTRMSRVKGSKTKYSDDKEGSCWVYVGSRELFNLE